LLVSLVLITMIADSSLVVLTSMLYSIPNSQRQGFGITEFQRGGISEQQNREGPLEIDLADLVPGCLIFEKSEA